jgi:hypothetical protein
MKNDFDKENLNPNNSSALNSIYPKGDASENLPITQSVIKLNIDFIKHKKELPKYRYEHKKLSLSQAASKIQSLYRGYKQRQ